MIIDLHVHTTALSACSRASPDDIAREARLKGLDGICLTEHNRAWDAAAARELSSRHGLVVLRGMEAETVEGHILTFGLDEDISGILRVADLRKMVDAAGGVMIAAHPFRGFLAFGVSDLRLSVERACRRPVFQAVDLIEAFSGNSRPEENELALKVSRVLGKKGVGGSDAHAVEHLGRCVTILDNAVSSEAELVAELKAGRFTAGAFSGGKERDERA